MVHLTTGRVQAARPAPNNGGCRSNVLPGASDIQRVESAAVITRLSLIALPSLLPALSPRRSGTVLQPGDEWRDIPDPPFWDSRRTRELLQLLRGNTVKYPSNYGGTSA